MPKQEIFVYKVTSDTQALSARVVHDTFVNFVKRELQVGKVNLIGLVPKRDGDMAAHVGYKGPIDDGILIEGSVGIPEIHKVGESSPLSAKYPVFVDKGTGVFGERGESIFANKPGGFMYLPPERGGGTEYPLFLRESKGQKGKEFMAATFASMIAAMRINGDYWKYELKEKLEADKILS